MVRARSATPSPDDLDRALDRVAAVEPDIADRARRHLRRSLAAVASSGIGDAAWATSTLTPAGAPVELAVTSAACELRTVSDVLAPEEGRHLALERSWALAAAAGATAPAGGGLDRLVAAQRSHRLRFGAWLGSRHGAHGCRYKLYAEVPADDWPLVDALAPGARTVVGGMGPLRFLGLPLDRSGAVEVYCRVERCDADVLAALCGRAGLGRQADQLLAAMGAQRHGPTATVVRGRNIGVSVVVADGRPAAVAAFTFASCRYRNDAAARRSLRRLSRSWPSAPLYDRLSAPLDQPGPPARPWHGPLSAVVAAGIDGAEHHVGLAPPPTTPDPPHHQSEEP